METEIKKEDKTEYNIKATLFSIENDEMVDEVFREYVSLSYPKLHKMNDEGLLNEQTKVHIKAMFMFIVKNRSSLERYYMFFNRVVESAEVVEEVVEEPKEKTVNRPRVRIKKADVIKRKKTDKSVCHDGALATLRLKNIHPRLERVYANEILFNEKLTDEQWNQIMGVINTTEQKINQILKGK